MFTVSYTCSPLPNFSYVGQGCDEEAAQAEECNEKGNEGYEGYEENNTSDESGVLCLWPARFEDSVQFSSLVGERCNMDMLSVRIGPIEV